MAAFEALIGIDPGVTTGVAIICSGSLLSVASMSAVLAEERVKRWHEDKGDGLLVVFEDARLRSWFGSKGREALQGAGSIKRDCQRWEEWLTRHGIKHQSVAPKAVATKLDARRFAAWTGWADRTNEHSRDAAAVIWQLRALTAPAGRSGAGRL